MTYHTAWMIERTMITPLRNHIPKNMYFPDSGCVRPLRYCSAGLMPTEARGNYLPEPPYLCKTKTYHSQPLESIQHAGNFFNIPLSIRPILIFVVAEVTSNYLTTDGLKKFSLLPEAPWGLRPVAFATSATWLIQHCQQIHIFEHNICQRQVARKTQSSTSWRPIINGTKANVALEKHTTKQKKTCKQREIKRQSLQKKKTKVENCSYARQ